MNKLRFNLDDFLKDIMRTYSFRSKSKNLEFDIIRENTLPSEVTGDPIRLNQILSNLLSNALKFAQKGGIHIILKEIEGNDKKSRIEFRVKDSGLGIPNDKHDIIFESFTQASPDTTRHYGGTGLGLAICKKLVRAPMAIADIGGLITSTLLTLVVVPVLYTLVDDLENVMKKRKA